MYHDTKGKSLSYLSLRVFALVLGLYFQPALGRTIMNTINHTNEMMKTGTSVETKEEAELEVPWAEPMLLSSLELCLNQHETTTIASIN
jgi:hypothetical protein